MRKFLHSNTQTHQCFIKHNSVQQSIKNAAPNEISFKHIDRLHTNM
uniref:Uncharacterized protein n=1 Tax=Rhizophora mucronata TaxID=61149 RepID=A0A2P2NLF2_RHIMU